MAFVPQLVNDPLGDPALYVGLPWERRGLLLDLGALESLSAAHILKVTEVFVSHTHVDHFIGFDHLLRVVLGRDRRLRLFGPPGLRGQVAGKLAGYTWNMTHEYPLVLEAAELHPGHLEIARFLASEGFARRHPPPAGISPRSRRRRAASWRPRSSAWRRPPWTTGSPCSPSP